MPSLFKRYPELRPSQVGVLSVNKEKAQGRAYDYIVIGGGTAGCVIASRLSEDPASSVLLIERGILADTWASRVPLISSDFSSASAPVYRWKTVPQKEANGQEFQIVAGKALGGTSRINSMLYTRGAPAEWNGWALKGLKGWSYENMVPYFLKSEKAADELTGEFHGRKGPWLVRTIDTWLLPFWPYVIEAATALGLPKINDVNDPSAPIAGAALIHRTQDPAGYRHATSTAFLPVDLALARRKNLKICTGTIAMKIDIEEKDEKKRAAGVYIQAEEDNDNHKVYYVAAKKEVIVSSGAFGSPQILMLSGIGAEDHLKEHNIPLVKHLPGVGQHLMDHVGVPLSWKVPIQHSLHSIQASIWVAITQLFKFILFGTGFFLLPVSQVSLFIRSALLSENSRLSPSPPEPPTTTSRDLDAHNPANIPDVEILAVPVNLNPATTFTTREGVFSLLTILVQPKSTGSVRLSSSDPRTRPVVDLGTLSAPEDIAILRKGLKFALELCKILEASKWADMQPFELPSSSSDESLDQWVRKTAQTEFHYSSTCRMAPEHEGGVVDEQLRVYEIQNLRVADASVFPSILATHTQAPTVVVAEKCADMVKAAS